MSDSVRPHRPQPTRLPRPWDSPGKNTGVGCRFLLCSSPPSHFPQTGSHSHRRDTLPGRITWTVSSVQLLSRVQLFATPWTVAHQASLFIANSWSLLKLMSIELVMPSSHLTLCRPLLLLPSIFPSIRVFSIESVLRNRWPKYWSFSVNISPSSEYSGLISFRLD